MLHKDGRVELFDRINRSSSSLKFVKGDGNESSIVSELIAGRYNLYFMSEERDVFRWRFYGSPIFEGSLSDLNIDKMVTSYMALSVLYADGTVQFIEDYPESSERVTYHKPKVGLTGVTDLVANEYAVSAIVEGTRVETWGREIYGGGIRREFNSPIRHLVANSLAFAAILEDGSVQTWGHDEAGGDSSYVADKLQNVKSIISTNTGFIAITEDNDRVAWGGLPLQETVDVEPKPVQ